VPITPTSNIDQQNGQRPSTIAATLTAYPAQRWLLAFSYACDIISNRIKNSKPTTAQSMKILRALLFICTFHTGCLAFYFRPNGCPISTSKLIYHTSSLEELDTRISFAAPNLPLLHLDDHNTFDDTKLNHMSNAIALHGGGCSDSTPASEK
jgi:hypothetical protein